MADNGPPAWRERIQVKSATTFSAIGLSDDRAESRHSTAVKPTFITLVTMRNDEVAGLNGHVLSEPIGYQPPCICLIFSSTS